MPKSTKRILKLPNKKEPIRSVKIYEPSGEQTSFTVGVKGITAILTDRGGGRGLFVRIESEEGYSLYAGMPYTFTCTE